MATVAIHGVRKRYADVDVIHGIDIDIADGEFIVVVGPSGCGKSTLLSYDRRPRSDYGRRDQH